MSANASGRFGTILAAPIPGLADGSGPNPALQVTAPAPPKRAPSQFVKKPRKKKKSNLTFVMLGLCALVLGVGVVVYVLAITHAR